MRFPFGATRRTRIEARGRAQLPDPPRAQAWLEPVRSSPDWEWLAGREDLPAAIARLRESGTTLALSDEAAEEVRAWVRRVGWGVASAPVRLVYVVSAQDSEPAEISAL